jgi:hypothetical protein
MNINHGILASQFDYDALLFLNATGITDPTIRLAINYLVFSLKINGLWNKFNAIYPIVGGTATTHRFNLRNPIDANVAFRLFFSGGWTHSANGALPNGTNSFADTFFTPSVSALQNSHHISYYSRTNVNLTQVEIGASTNSTNYDVLQLRVANNSYYIINQGAPYAFAANTNSQGYYIANRTASNVVNGWKNGVKVATATTLPNANSSAKIYIGALNTNNTTTTQYSTKECAFATIGLGLTDTEAPILYNIIQTFNTILGRQI